MLEIDTSDQYSTKVSILPGSDYKEVFSLVKDLYGEYQRKTKRKPHVRSAYFRKRKVFFDHFWSHLFDKGRKTRVQRLKFFPPALDLLRNSRCKPTIKISANKSEKFYRFYGMTSKEKAVFVVQVKEDLRKKSLFFMSVFPIK